jgi:hypothetical protein
MLANATGHDRRPTHPRHPVQLPLVAVTRDMQPSAYGRRGRTLARPTDGACADLCPARKPFPGRGTTHRRHVFRNRRTSSARSHASSYRWSCACSSSTQRMTGFFYSAVVTPAQRTHAKCRNSPLSRRLWGELSWREPDARRSRLSCTSGRGPTARIGMGRSRCWRHRVGPLVVAGVHGRRLMTTSTCARTVLRRWTWSCSRIGRGLTCTPTPGARRVCGTGLRLIRRAAGGVNVTGSRGNASPGRYPPSVRTPER